MGNVDWDIQTGDGQRLGKGEDRPKYYENI